MARGRKPIPVEKEKLQEVISALESRESFGSRNALWTKVADTEYAKEIGLTAQVAMLKAKALAITVNTVLGKRGRSKVDGPVPNAGKRKRRQRIPLATVAILKASYGPTHEKKVDRAARGSMKAAIALNCLNCTCQQPKEIRLCKITDCPLYHYRPYQKMKVQNEQGNGGEESSLAAN